MQETLAEVDSIGGKELIVELGLSVLDILVEFLAVFRVEGRQADKHLIDNRAKRPPISSFAVALPLQDLWRQVLSRAAKTFSILLPLDVLLRETKISQLDIAVARNEHIFRL